ncbi:hypothetical protein ACFLT2_11555 [Acidobacteriota bacterium]
MNFPKLSALKQIRRQCMNCCGDSRKFVRFCSDTECPLWHFRFGKSPKTFINENGETHKELFNKENFKHDGKYSPERVFEHIEV